MKVDTKKFFLALAIFLAVIIGLGMREYSSTSSNNLKNIQENLLEAATSTSIIANDTYFDRLLSQQISPVESASYTQNLTQLAKTYNMRELYTLVLDKNSTLMFGIGSVSAHDGKLLQPLDPITQNRDEYIRILNSNKTDYKMDNEQGSHTLYYPHITSTGIRTLTVAITEPISLQKLSQTAFFDTIAKSLLLFLGILPFLLLYRNVLASTAERLSHEVESTSERLHETSTILHERVEEKTKELIDEGFVDPLTHLSNRYRLIYDMDRNRYVALIIIHIHNLQDLNRYFGSSITDSLRQQFGLFLSTLNLPAYRLGRDEFALLLPTLPHNNIEKFAHFLSESIDQHTFNVVHEKISLHIHMGIDMSDHLTLAHADEALEHARYSNIEFSLYDEDKELKKHQEAHLALAGSIREAYYNGRIICYYQPIVATATGAILGYETLARLIGKDASILNPIDFLPIAQKTALYPEISREVLRQSCDVFHSRHELFSINLCHLDLHNSHTLRYIEESIVATNTAHRIIFDIPSQAIEHHYNLVTSFIYRMKLLGSKIAIDNFGADAINMMNILSTPIDYIKIDGTLISKLTSDAKYLKTLEAISFFAVSIGAATIAENVEDDETFILLKNSSIDYVQGFYIGAPAHLS